MRLCIRTAGIGLFNENPVGSAVPDTGPRFICPTKTKRKTRLARFKHFMERALQEAAPISEPLMIIAERRDPMVACHSSLRLPGLRKPKIVVSQVRGDMWLV